MFNNFFAPKTVADQIERARDGETIEIDGTKPMGAEVIEISKSVRLVSRNQAKFTSALRVDGKIIVRLGGFHVSNWIDVLNKATFEVEHCAFSGSYNLEHVSGPYKRFGILMAKGAGSQVRIKNSRYFDIKKCDALSVRPKTS